MAKIKLKFGENEIEIDSRDFYVDNETLDTVIDSITNHMQENKARFVYETKLPQNISKTDKKFNSNITDIKQLENIEIHDEEKTDAILLRDFEINDKLKILANDGFFDKPRNSSETCEQLKRFGWIASPLDVSKALAKMAFNKKLLTNSHGNRNFFFAKEALLTN